MGSTTGDDRVSPHLTGLRMPRFSTAWGSPLQILEATQTDGTGSFTLADGTGLAFKVPTGAATGLHLVYAKGQTSGHIGVGLFVVQ
jgi:hypothetical protein